MIANFQIAPVPEIHFGWNIKQQFLEHLIKQNHQHLILVLSRFQSAPGQFGNELLAALHESGTRTQIFTVSGEPSPDLVDAIVEQCDQQSEAVIGIGGGSVLDAAKAIAGLIPSQTSVMDYLEGVGKGNPLLGETLPFIALPTTAGTGSETTKNSVLSRIGAFKKSFRSEKLLAKSVWLDPSFIQTCPESVLYPTALDAFTQLLESYTTLKANPITDALAWQGMTHFKTAIEAIHSDEIAIKQQGYGSLMLASSLSGITLANAGLGAVHGLAGPIGAFFEAPHGAVCANLLAPITEQNILTLQAQQTEFASATLDKYQQVAQLLTGSDELTQLMHYLKRLCDQYIPQKLTDFGIDASTCGPVIENCRAGSMLGNPIELSDQQLIKAMLQNAT